MCLTWDARIVVARVWDCLTAACSPLRDLPRGQMSWDTADIYRRQYRAPGWIASALQQPDQEGLRRSGRRVLVPKVTISDLTGDRRILQFGFNVVLSAFPKAGRSGADP